jgi:lipopolysaccharide transport system ATP-binding protein
MAPSSTQRAEIRAKFDEIVTFSGVEQFLDTAVKHYSSGMYVRLAFAVAAHLEPEILVVDEVLAVGDAAFQAKCLAKMDDVAGKEGRTVLFVSHNLAAVQGLCRAGVLLEQGRVIERGPIAQVLDAYQRALVAGPAGQASDLGVVPDDGARIIDWELRGASTGDLYSCFARETCKFVFKVASKMTADEIYVGFLILNAQGEIVVGATSLDQTPAHFPLTPGIHELSITVPMPLKPGVYHLDVSLNNRARGQLDWAHPVPALSILPHGPTQMAQKYQGSLNLAAKFDLHLSA